MKLVIGLGNPGEEYVGTRHNVGFYVLDRLVGDGWKSWGKSEIKRVGGVVYAKPRTFMNRSGEAAVELRNFYKLANEDVLVIHDDLDLCLGEYKLQRGVGPKAHNGVLSINEYLGDDYYRLRLGVDMRGGEKIDGERYVLEKFSEEEEGKLETVIEAVIIELKNGHWF